MLSPRYFYSLVLLCLLSSMPGRILAQDFNYYQPLRSEGDMPAKFTTSSTEKYKKDVAKKVSDKDQKKDRKAKEQFLLESNFQIDQLLLSGKVLFNDPVSLYINKVLDEVLKDDPKLRSEIEAYAVKSPAVNAFSTDNGIILVNVGLIAHLDNEAQLAYVLSHEIIHYKKQHSLDEYVEQSKMESGRGLYKGTSVDDRLLARSNYSKGKESEADLEGLKIFLKTNYSIEALDKVFDVLAYSELPYMDVELRKSFLDRGSLVIPPDYWKASTDSIKADKDDDSLSSHPAVAKRRQAVAELVKGQSNTGRKNFIVSEDEFFKVRKICRFESNEQFLQNRNFESAFYNSYLLLQDDSTNEYLQVSAFEALYGLAKYSNGSTLSNIHTDPEEVSGSSQRVYYMVDKMSAGELSLVALIHGWELYQKYPDNKRLAAEVHDLFKETVTEDYPDKDFFSTTPPVKVDTTVVEESTNADGTKDVKDSKPKKKKKKKKQVDMAKYALVDLLKDSAFVKEYDGYVDALNKKSTRKKKKKDEEDDHMVFVFEGDDTAPSSAPESGNTDKLAASKLLVVNPFYYNIKTTGKQAIHYEESEAGQSEFRRLIRSTAKKVGLSCVMLDAKELNKTSTAAFNDIAALTEYIDRVADDGDIVRVNHMTDELQAIRQKYNTRYVCWTGILAARVRDEDGDALWQSSVNCILFLPFAIYQSLAPDYRTYFFTIIMDLETGKTAYARTESYGIKADSDVVRGTVYYTLADIKAKTKKKKKR